MSVNEKMTAIADAIRTKTGGTDALTLDQMAAAVSGITGGGGGYSIEDIGVTDGISGNLEIDFKMTRGYAFYGLTGIGKVTLKHGYVGSYDTAVTNLFAGSSVTEVYGDSGDTYGAEMNPYMFQNCKSLKKVVLKGFRPRGACFSGCTALEYLDLDTDFNSDNCLQNCSSLKTIILRKGSVCPVAATTYWAFSLNGTPYDNNPAGTGGTVYVPEALIEAYKTATNWSVLYEAGTVNFVAIEGSEYE